MKPFFHKTFMANWAFYYIVDIIITQRISGAVEEIFLSKFKGD